MASVQKFGDRYLRKTKLFAGYICSHNKLTLNMNRRGKKQVLMMVMICLVVVTTAAAQAEPWRTDQLMQPADLARVINDASAPKPAIFNIGPAGRIKGSVDIGATGEADNLKQLKAELAKLPRNTEVVIYCGCCPFANCPNIRPAFQLLQQMKFTNAHLLNIPKNLRVDWISKGYPMMGN